MRLIQNPNTLIKVLKEYKLRRKSIGFVPTMGALHDGHLSLIKKARKENDILVISIFVNPIQFGPKEDFERYPRCVKKDLSLCRKEGVDLVFFPGPSQMFPHNFNTFVKVEELSSVLCGESRPNHFQGVTTIVTKLFNIISPDIAYFGQKDAQQAAIIKKMVKDLNIPVTIKVLPIIREKNGLALSSRNAYLSKGEREDALVLSQALKFANLLIKNGARDANRIISRIKNLIKKKKRIKIDYIAIVNSSSLKPQKKISAGCLIALAVHIGKTRLIDNIIVRI